MIFSCLQKYKRFIDALFRNIVGTISFLQNRLLIYFTTKSPNILASIRLSRMDKTAHVALVTSTIRGGDNMNVDAADVVDLAVIEEEVKDVAWALAEAEAEAEDEVTIPIHYIVHMLMAPLLLKLRFMIKVCDNSCLRFANIFDNK